MLRKLFFIGMSFFWMVSCELNERLDMQALGGSPGYFIECYCCPDSMFELTATRIAPVSEPQVLDYSLEFDVHILAGERIKMYHSLFTRPGTGFVYNYASSRRLDASQVDTVHLEVVAPGGGVIRASTPVPPPVAIDSVVWREGYLDLCFTASARAEENRYVVSFSWRTPEGEWKNRIAFPEDCPPSRPVRYAWRVPVEAADTVEVSLKRFTPEGHRYQQTLYEARKAGEESLFAPVEVEGNISGALGIFTCYTEDRRTVRKPLPAG